MLASTSRVKRLEDRVKHLEDDQIVYQSWFRCERVTPIEINDKLNLLIKHLGLKLVSKTTEEKPMHLVKKGKKKE